MRDQQRTIIADLHVSPEIDPADQIDRRVGFLQAYLRHTGAAGLVLGISRRPGLVPRRASLPAGRRGPARRGRARDVLRRPPAVHGAGRRGRRAAGAAVHPPRPRGDVQHPPRRRGRSRPSTPTRSARPLSDFVKGNVKARARMIAQYAIAGQANALVVGTDHAAEAVTGFFTKYGDGGADVLPLAGLTKRQGGHCSSTWAARPGCTRRRRRPTCWTSGPARPTRTTSGLTYADLDDYLEGREVAAEVALAIEARYAATEHKRQTPLSMFDGWWEPSRQPGGAGPDRGMIRRCGSKASTTSPRSPATRPRNVDFYAGVLGLRMVEKTVNQDDPTVYHLFYADEDGSPGSDITFFEYPGAAPGRAGAGMVHRVVWRVGADAALDFWADAAGRRGRRSRARRRRLRFADPEGLEHELRVVDVPDAPLQRRATRDPARSTRCRASTASAPAACGPRRPRRCSRTCWAPSAGATTPGRSAATGAAPRSRSSRAGERGMQGAGTIHHIAWDSTERGASAVAARGSRAPASARRHGRPPLLPLDLLPRAGRDPLRDRRPRPRLHARPAARRARHEGDPAAVARAAPRRDRGEPDAAARPVA